MASTSNPQEAIRGLIVRTSATPARRHAHFSIPNVDDDQPNTVVATDSIAHAFRFPNITVLDAIPSNILYRTSNAPPDFFHVYNYVSRTHFHFTFPNNMNFANAAIVTHKCNYFKVIVACATQNENAARRPVVFFVYSSETGRWSQVYLRTNPSFAIDSDVLLPRRRKPVHVGDGVVYLNVIENFLIRFESTKKHVEILSKLVSSWEEESGKVDEEAVYGECEELLHCAKTNPGRGTVEIWRMREGFWGLVGIGKEGILKGRKVVGLHPNVGSMVFVKLEDKDEIFMVDFRRDLEWECLIEGWNDLLGLEEEGWEEGRKKLRLFGTDILVPCREEEGEIFIFWLFEKKLELR